MATHWSAPDAESRALQCILDPQVHEAERWLGQALLAVQTAVFLVYLRAWLQVTHAPKEFGVLRMCWFLPGSVRGFQGLWKLSCSSCSKPGSRLIGLAWLQITCQL